MTGHFLEIGLLSWFPDDTFYVHVLIEYFKCYFYVFIQHCQLTVYLRYCG